MTLISACKVVLDLHSFDATGSWHSQMLPQTAASSSVGFELWNLEEEEEEEEEKNFIDGCTRKTSIVWVSQLREVWNPQRRQL